MVASSESSNPHIYLVFGEVSVLLPMPETWANLKEVAENEFGVVPRYIEFRSILDGEFCTSRAYESGWQELRKDLERGYDGIKKPVIRIST